MTGKPFVAQFRVPAGTVFTFPGWPLATSPEDSMCRLPAPYLLNKYPKAPPGCYKCSGVVTKPTEVWRMGTEPRCSSLAPACGDLSLSLVHRPLATPTLLLSLQEANEKIPEGQ